MRGRVCQRRERKRLGKPMAPPVEAAVSMGTQLRRLRRPWGHASACSSMMVSGTLGT